MENPTPYEKAKKRVDEKLGFYSHLAVYLLVNIILIIINFTQSPDELWFFWPLMGWGVGIVLDALRVFRGGFGSTWEARKIDELMRNES